MVEGFPITYRSKLYAGQNGGASFLDAQSNCEPYYSYSRIMMTKFFIFVLLFNDLYDNHSTTEESNIFTTAMERLHLFA
jgi:hypothetical protein